VIDPDGLMMIHVGRTTSAQPVMDNLTCMMAAALRASHRSERVCRGAHRCACGARSDNHIYTLPDGCTTNSLAVHYLAFHRADVPAAELAKVLALGCPTVEPTASELQAPKPPERPAADQYQMPGSRVRRTRWS